MWFLRFLGYGSEQRVLDPAFSPAPSISCESLVMVTSCRKPSIVMVTTQASCPIFEIHLTACQMAKSAQHAFGDRRNQCFDRSIFRPPRSLLNNQKLPALLPSTSSEMISSGFAMDSTSPQGNHCCSERVFSRAADIASSRFDSHFGRGSL